MGQWLHIDDDGKPGMCYKFGEKRKLDVFRNATCTGNADSMLSGKWQMKGDNRVAVLRESEGQARAALITEHDDNKFVATGALLGSFFHVDENTDAEALIEKLREEGIVKWRLMNDAAGCKLLGRSIDTVRALPIEKKPHMLRNRDRGLEFHVDTATGDPLVERIVFAINQDQVDWISLHLKPEAFEAPGPEGRLEGKFGKPTMTLTTGKGEEKQNIAMWRSYCADLRGEFNKSVDVTLFATAGKREGMYYLSEGVLQELWEDLKHMVETSAEEEAEEEKQDTPEPTNAAPNPAPAPSPAPAPAPKAAEVTPPKPAAAPEKVAPPTAPVSPKAKAKQQPTGNLAVPGEDDI